MNKNTRDTDSIRNRISHALVAAVLVGLAIVGRSADAAVIASYPFNSGSAASTDTEPNSTSLGFTVVDGTNDGSATVDSGISGTTFMPFLRGEAIRSTQALGLGDDDYFSFTVTAASGYYLNLTSLVFDFGASTPVAYTTNVYVQSSVDGFGSAAPVIDSFTKVFAGSTPSGGATPVLDTGLTVDLSAAAFQSLAGITLRFYFSDNLDTATSISRADNVVLNGTVTLPAPAALPAGLALLGLITMRRRGRR